MIPRSTARRKARSLKSALPRIVTSWPHLARELEPRGDARIARVAERDLGPAVAKCLAAITPSVADVAVTLDARVDVAKIPHAARLGIAGAA